MTPGCSIEQDSCAVLCRVASSCIVFTPNISSLGIRCTQSIRICLSRLHFILGIGAVLSNKARRLDHQTSCQSLPGIFVLFLSSRIPDLAQTAFSLHVISIQSPVDSVAETPLPYHLTASYKWKIKQLEAKRKTRNHLRPTLSQFSRRLSFCGTTLTISAIPTQECDKRTTKGPMPESDKTRAFR